MSDDPTEPEQSVLHRYEVYGLGLHSELPLPPLRVADHARCDIRVRVREPDPDVPALERHARSFHAEPQNVIYRWGELGALHAQGGSELIVEPTPDADPLLLRLWVLGPGLGLLLNQRGILILHASAVAIDGRAVIFLGAPQWGKSTLAAALQARGHPLLSDDITALVPGEDGRHRVLPGVPQIKLWPDAVSSLAIGAEGTEIHRECPKQVFALPGGFAETEAPLELLCLLEPGEEVAVDPLDTAQGLHAVLAHWYGGRFGTELLEPTGLENHFRRCVSLLQGLRVCRLRRSSDIASIAEVAAAVEAEVVRSRS